ncbi:hypothetical protein [Mycolicibacterium iranicum]|uniref:HNH endonuclease n=1 Tax=Mycolicibacterium iranicum TaxID=912594 RepID=A0ABT4HQ38_MYCIR|nr:hypothetical protein [Mycolicibacterium iranicum]MCZ0732316.1 hypothetical protein [Mycolicibacterium iranicum]
MSSHRRASTTARGLGWAHRQRVERLRANHIDGTPCWWCGEPLFRDKTRNWDGIPLHGDHSVPRSQGGRAADRLLHHTCNSRRGDGRRDHLRPALEADDDTSSPEDLGDLAMGWPTP